MIKTPIELHFTANSAIIRINGSKKAVSFLQLPYFSIHYCNIFVVLLKLKNECNTNKHDIL